MSQTARSQNTSEMFPGGEYMYFIIIEGIEQLELARTASDASERCMPAVNVTPRNATASRGPQRRAAGSIVYPHSLSGLFSTISSDPWIARRDAQHDIWNKFATYWINATWNWTRNLENPVHCSYGTAVPTVGTVHVLKAFRGR